MFFGCSCNGACNSETHLNIFFSSVLVLYFGSGTVNSVRNVGIDIHDMIIDAYNTILIIE